MKFRAFLWMPAILMLLASCTGKKEESQSGIIVKTEKAVPYDGGEGKEYTFISRPFRTSELSFRVSGPIDHFDVYSGNYYPKGSTIAEIDSRDFKIRKEQAGAVYDQMKTEFERIEKLFQKNNIPASQYEKTKADYTKAKTTFEMASNDLADTRLTAPFNGYVGEVYIEKFQDVRAAQPVLELIDIDRLRIETYVTQEVATAARSLDSVAIRFDMYPDKVYKAPIVEISKGTTRNNLSYLLTALLPNPDRKLLSGMSGKVYLHPSTGNTHTGVVIPQYALCHRPTIGDFVWVVNEADTKANMRKVRKGKLLPDGKVLITEGLSKDETIATSGLRFLSDGSKVELSPKKN